MKHLLSSVALAFFFSGSPRTRVCPHRRRWFLGKVIGMSSNSAYLESAINGLFRLFLLAKTADRGGLPNDFGGLKGGSSEFGKGGFLACTGIPASG